MVAFISSLETIKVVILHPNTLLLIAVSVVDAAAVNPNGIKTLLVKGLSTFFIEGKPVFRYGPKGLPRDPPDCPILCNWVFDDFILDEELFGKTL